MAEFNFSELTPDLILDAIESTGIVVDSGLLALNSYENRVYQFKDVENKRYVVKIYRPERWSDQQIQEEHDFTLELLAHEVPIAAPIALQDKTLHTWQQYRFTVFPSVGGRQFEVDNLEQLEWMGRFIGRIHAVAASKPFVFRPSIDSFAYLDQPLSQLSESQIVPAQLHDAFFTILKQVIEATKYQLFNVDNIRLHGDCHPGNILWRDGPTFVDMDDCRSGPAIQDLWMMLSGDRANQLLQLDVLLEAYEEFCEFDPQQLRLIEPLRAMRLVHYMAWLDKRWSDPAFPAAFPWFGEAKYWEQQILSLKEQLSQLNEAPLSLTPGY